MSEPINWQLATAETVANLSRLIQAKTVNPPGNELPANLIVKEILEQAGFPNESFINERMPISFIETGLPVLWDVVNEFCGNGS